jgi:ribosomal protein S18 acetylase RimI-like enzyme
MHFELRPATPADRDWLFALDCATMGAEGGGAGGPELEVRRASFDRHFDPSAVSVIRTGGRDAGALRLEERAGALYLAVLEVTPELQGRRLGTAVLRQVLARAAAERRPVVLRVRRTNVRARRLYERLGFRVAAETDAKYELQHDGPEPPAG